jgi:hypothetical protein
MDEDAYMSLASGHVALVEQHREVVAERDRLRAVVDGMARLVAICEDEWQPNNRPNGGDAETFVKLFHELTEATDGQ